MSNEKNEFPNKVSNKCPAIILAVRRTDKVIGRIIKLVDSIITIKVIKAFGVPDGIRWAINCLKLL